MRPLQKAMRDVPVVVVGIIDPVAAGLAARYRTSAKYLELLKKIAPATTRAPKTAI